MRKKLAGAGGSAVERETPRQPLPAERCSCLAEGRKWLCLLCNTDVCVQPGLEGREGRG